QPNPTRPTPAHTTTPPRSARTSVYPLRPLRALRRCGQMSDVLCAICHVPCAAWVIRRAVRVFHFDGVPVLTSPCLAHGDAPPLVSANTTMKDARTRQPRSTRRTTENRSSGSTASRAGRMRGTCASVNPSLSFLQSSQPHEGVVAAPSFAHSATYTEAKHVEGGRRAAFAFFLPAASWPRRLRGMRVAGSSGVIRVGRLHVVVPSPIAANRQATTLGQPPVPPTGSCPVHHVDRCQWLMPCLRAKPIPLATVNNLQSKNPSSRRPGRPPLMSSCRPVVLSSRCPLIPSSSRPRPLVSRAASVMANPPFQNPSLVRFPADRVFVGGCMLQ
ncbi:MAG: hypothetical protein FE78DRAFT_437809, partial [Acidomyces sp. 'richmondensis']